MTAPRFWQLAVRDGVRIAATGLVVLCQLVPTFPAVPLFLGEGDGIVLLG